MRKSKKWTRQPFGDLALNSKHKENRTGNEKFKRNNRTAETSTQDQIHKNLKKNELKAPRYSNDNNGARYFEARRVYFDWLHFVQKKRNLRWQTLLICCNIIDRYFHRRLVEDQNDMKLTVATAIWMAAKLEEIYPPHSGFFARELGFSLRQMVAHEGEICNVIQWDLWSPTPLDFLSIYFYHLDMECTSGSYLSKVFVDIFVQEPGYAMHYPSEVAAAAVLLGQLYVSRDVSISTGRILKVSGHDEGIINLASDMNDTYMDIYSRNTLQNVLHKYSGKLKGFEPRNWVSLTKRMAALSIPLM